MEYTALYRKYRPRSFSELIGQEHIAITLKNALALERISHAYLFCGPRGTGKTSVAHILSRGVNCTDLQWGEPCGKCESCQTILSGGSMDILEFDAASKRGIDEIRDLLERVKYSPVQGRYKVYIIDEVHMLTNEAFNALLKTLEEPPQHVIFILATTEAHKVPATIISRCQRFDFHRVGDEAISGHLLKVAKNEGRELEPKAAELLSRRSWGGLRDALGLLDQCMVFATDTISEEIVAKVLGTATEDVVRKMAIAVAEENSVAILEIIEELNENGVDLRQFLLQFLDFLRYQVLLQARGEKVIIGRNRALAVLAALIDADTRLRTSPLPRITLEVAFLTASLGSNSPAVPLEENGEATIEQKRSAQVANSPAEAIQPTAQVESREIAFFNEKWKAILDAVRKKSAVTSAFFQMSTPYRFEGNTLYLSFPDKYQLHKAKTFEDANRIIIEEVLSTACKRKIEIAPTEDAQK